MEARKIIVISSANQNQYTLMSTAETLGELKRELDERHVDYNGMTFLEGHTKTEMNLDEAILPTNIPYRGTTTNELVFLLTAPQKKIKSGVDRIAIYGIIKDRHLEEAINEKFGKSYTNLKTDSLEEFINSLSDEGFKQEVNVDELVAKIKELGKAVLGLYDVLVDAGVLEKNGCKCKKSNPLSEDDIADLFGDMVDLGYDKEEDEDEDGSDE